MCVCVKKLIKIEIFLRKLIRRIAPEDLAFKVNKNCT